MPQLASPMACALPPSWMERLQQELSQEYMINLMGFLEREYQAHPGEIFPSRNEIFSAFIATPFDKVKVVIIGQDPYHGIGQAHGLSFSVQPGVRLPPSLQNIYKELQSDLGISPPTSGYLMKWAENGVLLLNATLTVRKSEPMSHHKKGWERFTDAVVRTLLREKKELVFLLWGKNAQEKCLQFENEIQKEHLILKAPHPSPYSANQGFFGCKHFSKTDAYLIERGIEPVSWAL
ncbi:MAG: uracil-DNA glycosylase [Chlamydia sp.]